MHSRSRSVRASACAYVDHAACESGSSRVARLGRRDLGADVAGEVVGEREVEQSLDGRSHQPRALERGDRGGAIHQLQPQAAEALPRRRVAGRALGRARGGLGGEVERAHVLVDPRGEALGRRAVGVDARPVADRARRRRQVARLPERHRQQPQHGRIVRLGVARVDEALGGEPRDRPRRARAGRRS